jgi:thymidylate synthase ThyX
VELKRHRMMTQTPQSLSASLGYAVPEKLVEAGFEAAYRTAMETARETYEALVEWNPAVAAYVVPNGFNRRVLLTLNLREAFAFCQLRSAPQAHFSMRRVAERIAAEIAAVHPLLAKYMPLPAETWQEVERKSFAQT